MSQLPSSDKSNAFAQCPVCLGPTTDKAGRPNACGSGHCPMLDSTINLEGVTGDEMDKGAERAALETRLMAAASTPSSIERIDAEPPQPSLYDRRREETLKLAREVLRCSIPDGEGRQGILWAKRFANELISTPSASAGITKLEQCPRHMGQPITLHGTAFTAIKSVCPNCRDEQSDIRNTDQEKRS